MKNICKAPLFTAEVFGNGNVFSCCPDYVKIGPIGNIFQNSWDDIWNSEIAQNFRAKICNENYSSCYTNYCSPNFFPLCHELKYINQDKLDINNPKARIIKFSMDLSCNVACKICRKDIICNESSRTEFLNSKIYDTFLPILKDAEIVNFTGSGDPFASKHCREFIKIINQTYPNIRFNFHTNGTLCNKKTLEDLGVLDKLSTIEISVHSATKEVYDNIVRYGNWDMLNKNLEFLSQLISNGKLDELQLNFVVFSENYKSIPDFINFAQQYQAKAFLWQYRDWDQLMDYDSVNVCYPLHKHHRDFVKIMSSLDLNNPNLFITPLLRKYTQIKDVDEYCSHAETIVQQIEERYESKKGIFKKRLDQIQSNNENIKKLIDSKKDLESKVQKNNEDIKNLIESKKDLECKIQKNNEDIKKLAESKRDLEYIIQKNNEDMKNLIKSQKVFSITNEYSKDKKHKVVKIFGLKLKFRVKNKRNN